MTIRRLLLLACLMAPTTVLCDDFDSWKADFIKHAVQQGIAEDLAHTALDPVTLDPKVIELDRAQPEFFKGPGAYVTMMVSDARTQRGRALLLENVALLDHLERHTGVTGTLPVAVWGVETAFGSNMGSMDVVRSLATLAYDGRRRQWAEDELISALKLIARGQAPLGFAGSWAGAFGHTQFMPSSALKLAVDGDGNGSKDLYTPADALASAAYYLQKSGWRRGEPWVVEVTLPAGLVPTPERSQSVKDWLANGVSRPNGISWQAAWMDLPAKVLLPTGRDGPAFLIFRNFEVIKRYNASTSYALSVGLLANRISGDGPVSVAWPDVKLSRSDVVALQNQLAQRGYDVGGADGQMGPKTRAALAAFQSASGLPADGFPSTQTLALLKVDAPAPAVVAVSPAPVVPAVVPPVVVTEPEKPKRKRFRLHP